MSIDHDEYSSSTKSNDPGTGSELRAEGSSLRDNPSNSTLNNIVKHIYKETSGSNELTRGLGGLLGFLTLNNKKSTNLNVKQATSEPS